MTTKSNKDYSVLKYYLNKQTLNELKKIINHFKQLDTDSKGTLSVKEKERQFYRSSYMLSDASFALIKDNDYYRKQAKTPQERQKRINNLNNGLEAIAKLNDDDDENSIDIYEWIFFNKYMDFNNDKDKEKFLKNSQEKINGLKEDRSYDEINIRNKQNAFPRKSRYEEYLNILRNFKSNIEAKSNQKEVKFDNKPKTVPPLKKLSDKTNNLTSARSNLHLSTVRTLTSHREGLEATNRISEQMRDVRSKLINEWNELYKNFKEMYKDSYIILNKQSIPTKDFERYLKNSICKSQNISQKNINKFINLQGQTEQKEVLYKVNKIILLCRYVNELYCIIGNFKDKLKDEQKTNVDKGIKELQKIIENLLKINTKDNTDTLDINDIDSICGNIKDILDNFKEVIKGIKSDLDVPFIDDNFKTIEIPNYMKSTNSKKTTPENKNVVNFKEILEQIEKQDKDNNAINLLNYIKAEEEEFNLSKIVVGSNGQDIKKSKQYLEKILDFYSVHYKKNRPIINPNREHQAFIQKLNNKLIDILNKDVILNIELLKYNFLDAEKVYAEIINEIKGNTKNKNIKEI